jgi:hypothetical protein
MEKADRSRQDEALTVRCNVLFLLRIGEEGIFFPEIPVSRQVEKCQHFFKKANFCLSSFDTFLVPKKLNILNRIIFLLLLSKSQFCHHIMKIHHQKKKK